MDHRHQPTSQRGPNPTPGITAPAHFEWTRQPGTGPDLAILGELRGKNVIEIGCGCGHNLAYLVTHHGITGIGIDHNAEKITRALHAYGHLPGINFIRADAVDHLTSTQQASIDICLSIFGALWKRDHLAVYLNGEPCVWIDDDFVPADHE